VITSIAVRPTNGGRIGTAAGMLHKPHVSPAGEGRERAAETGNGSMVCSEAQCGRSLTKAQYEFSVRAFGKVLCPHCQKQRKSEAAAAVSN
jgi:hypothetical protein